jgi:hypothetical protein
MKKKLLWYCLSIVLLTGVSQASRAQAHKRKHHTTHTAHINHKPSDLIHYRPAGWSDSRPAYTHAPILWEGYRYYTYHRYYAHPYEPALATDTLSLRVGDETFYYYAGRFYLPVQEQTGYQLVKAPAGACVYDLPAGCTRIHAGAVVFLQYSGDYFLPVMVGERPGYEVVNIEPSSPRW